MKTPISENKLEQYIYLIRGQRVMLDADLARLYGVTTKALNQAVRRNKERFPGDFLFQLTKNEKEEVVTSCDHLRQLKFSYQRPYAFSQEGLAMLSSVLKSKKAILCNIAIMRAFVRLKHFLVTNHELAKKLRELESKVEKNDREIQAIFQAIRQLMTIPDKPKKQIGFHPKEE